MVKRLFFVLVFLWAISIGGVLFYFVTWAQKPDMETISQNIAEILNESSDKENHVSYVLNYLPDLFSHEPALTSIFLSDREDKLLGSMFDQNRLSAKKYNILQQNFTQVIEKGLGGNHQLIKLISQKSNLHFYLIFTKNISYQEMYQKVYHNQNDLFLIGFFYLLGGAILAFLGFIFLFFIGKKNSTKTTVENVQVSKVNQFVPEVHGQKKKDLNLSNLKEPKPKQKKETAMLLPKIFPSLNYLEVVLKKLCEKVNCQKIFFYGLEQNRWFAILGISQNKVLDKNAIGQLPDLLVKNNIHNKDNFENVVVDSSNQEAMALVWHHNMIVGAFHFSFDEDVKISKYNLEKWTRQFGNSISANRTFQQAVVNEDLGLYTYPYFFFSLKELVKQNITFYTLIMRIPSYSTLDKEIWEHWNFFREKFFKEYIEDSPITAWLENDRILLNIKEDYFQDSKHMVNVCRHFIKQTQNIANTRVHAALVEGESQDYNMDRFVQTLSKALQKAEVTGDFIIARRVGVVS